MKKKKGLLFIFGILFFMIGLVLFILGTADLEFGLSRKATIIFTIAGVIFFIVAIVLIILYINNIVKSSKELTVNENDERNVMIRGKAAEKTIFLTVFMMLALEFLLMVLKEPLAALLVSIVMLITCFFNVIFISVLQKKL